MVRVSSLPLDGRSLTLNAAGRVLRGEPLSLTIPKAAKRAIQAARSVVIEKLKTGDALYGINTGFGKLSRVRIDDTRLERLQENLIVSHACGTGAPLPAAVARLALLLRANALARGHSGVRLELVERLVDLFSAGIAPVIPEQGSVGASGDLAPLAHLALLLLGRGEAWIDGKRLAGRSLENALAARGFEAMTLAPKEGLALINGTQVSTALAVAGALHAKRLAKVADIATALTIEATRGSAIPFDASIHEIRPHRGQQDCADNVRRLLAGSEVLPSHAHCGKVQDAYALRCAPQVHGAARDTFDHVTTVLEREMNSVTDNPLIFPDSGEIRTGGNFHAEPVAMVADFAAIAAAELGSISERRIENLVNPELSGLPPFLAADPGLDSGYMIAQVTAAAIVSENKTLCHPASVDSIPTSAGKEDHVSMATWAGRKLNLVTANVERVLAIELLAATQGIDLAPGPRLRPGRGAAIAYRSIRSVVKAMDRDREVAPDIESVRRIVADGSLVAAVEKACGPLL